MFSEVPTTVRETQGLTEVCVQLNGTLERSITVNVNFENIDTAAEDFDNTPETFTFGSGETDEQCFQLLINADNMLENDERFNIVLSSPNNDVVDILNENSQVTIQDSSTLELGFSNVPPSVMEGESFSACVRINRGSLSEQFQLPVNIVSLSVQGEYIRTRWVYQDKVGIIVSLIFCFPVIRKMIQQINCGHLVNKGAVSILHHSNFAFH